MQRLGEMGLFSDSWSWDLVVGGALIVLLLVLGVVVAPWVRRRFHPSNIDNQDEGAVFDIARLEQMRREGMITQEEFRKLRRVALGLAPTDEKAENSASSAPCGSDDDEVSEPRSSDQDRQADADENEPDKES